MNSLNIRGLTGISMLKVPAKDLSIVKEYFNNPANTTLPLVMLAMEDFLKNFNAIIRK